MSETLPSPEDQPILPMQWLSEHIDTALKDQPVDPGTGYQHTTKYINGDKRFPVAYVRNQNSGVCVVAISSPPSRSERKNWRKNQSSMSRPVSEIIITYDPNYHAYDPRTATRADQEQRALSQETKINYLRAIEPLLKDRSYGIFGSIVVLLGSRGKARYPKNIQ